MTVARFFSQRLLRGVLRDQSGSAAVELALVAGTLASVMMNGIEISRWYFSQMELQNATQMAAQAVWKACDSPAKLPVTINCSARTAAMNNALQSTSLGTRVTLSSGYPTEAYYCVATSGGALTNVGSVSNAKPVNCSPTGSTSDTPGDYIVLRAQYTYSPIFYGITIGSLLPTEVTAQTMMRVR